MWKFADLPYERPDMDAFRADHAALTAKFEAAESYAVAREAYLERDALSRKLQTAYTIASIRNTMDTTDTFYEAEMAFLNRAMAEFMPLEKQATDALLRTPYREDFIREYGPELFNKAELEIKTQSEAIVPDLITESELEEEYKKVAAGCQVEFMGETCNFYGLLKFMESPDRDVRRAAFQEWAKLYESVSDQLDAIFDKLVQLRVRMAKTLGFADYASLAYANRGRTDYTAKDVAAFREQVREIIVPAVARYRQAQAKRIGVDKLHYYDEGFMFPDGNADPVGGEDVLIPAGVKMYHELSEETGVFFDFMVEHGLFDLQTRPGKHLGGYCTVLAGYDAPFIFSNFNGTAADVGVLTHEAGHAFAFFTSSKAQTLNSYLSSTAEVCEIHSMSMEHFTYPWMNLMYGEDNVAKAKYAHLVDAISAVPYLVSVDEYQHRVYEKPEMTAKERRAVWRDIERKYMPWRDYDGNAFLEEGGFWMQKQHIFLYPFYYVDYALAQVSAFELYGRMKQDLRVAWQDYLRLCAAGGSKNYFALLKLANLSNPFEAGTVQKAVGHVIEELDAQA